MKLHEDGRRLADLVAAGVARVLSVTVRFERGRWFASFAVETEVSRPAPRLPNAVVGVDLGVKTLAVLSTGEEIPNPRHLSGALRKLRRLSRAVSRRRGLDRRTGREPSNRWRRADASFGEFRWQVECKARWHGGRVIVAGRWFASSKTCSGCGALKAKLPLSERTYA